MAQPALTLPGIATEPSLRELLKEMAHELLRDLQPIQAERLTRHFPAFRADVRRSAANLGLSDPFPQEETNLPPHPYPREHNIKPIAEQMKTLGKTFSIPTDEAFKFGEEALPKLPLAPGAEGRFAAIWPKALAGRFFNDFKSWPEQYCAAVRMMLQAVQSAWGLEIDEHIQITPDRFIPCPPTIQAWDAIAAQQNGHPILVFDGQFGKRHGGRSARKAIVRSFQNEFGLDIIAVGAMLLDHYDRFHNRNSLTAGCLGNECALDGQGFKHAPVFRLRKGRLYLEACSLDFASQETGWVTGFVPQ